MVLNPAFSITILYTPGARLEIEYAPEGFVSALLAEFVAWLVAVIFAPGTTAPVESVTVPEMDPEVCANNELASVKKHKSKLAFRNFITYSPGSSDHPLDFGA